MKIVKIVGSKKNNAFASIKTSMDSKKGISVMNSLDACGCTGNGQC